jgi:hypothetical protein
MCGGISLMSLFMVTAAMQNKIKAMKAKMKELMLAHNNQVIS